jgi:hypothetical protein
VARFRRKKDETEAAPPAEEPVSSFQSPEAESAAESPAAESPASVASENGDPFAQRPEIFVGAAFVGGLALAQILKRFGR